MQPARSLLIAACLLAATGVGLGAIGAHGLEDYLTNQGLDADAIAKKIDQCDTGVRYQLYHALALFALGLSSWSSSKAVQTAGWMMIVGCLFFSGGIYSIVFLNQLGHWAIVPAGGLLMIVSWILLAICASLPKPPRPGCDT